MLEVGNFPALVCNATMSNEQKILNLSSEGAGGGGIFSADDDFSCGEDIAVVD